MFRRGLTLALLSAVVVTISTPWATSQQQSQQEAPVPAYNSGPPPTGTKLPPILAKEQLWGENAQYPFQTHAYELASRIPTVLHHQPCYCYDDPMCHNNLHSFVDNAHGPQCTTSSEKVY